MCVISRLPERETFTPCARDWKGPTLLYDGLPSGTIDCHRPTVVREKFVRQPLGLGCAPKSLILNDLPTSSHQHPVPSTKRIIQRRKICIRGERVGCWPALRGRPHSSLRIERLPVTCSVQNGELYPISGLCTERLSLRSSERPDLLRPLPLPLGKSALYATPWTGSRALTLAMASGRPRRPEDKSASRAEARSSGSCCSRLHPCSGPPSAAARSLIEAPSEISSSSLMLHLLGCSPFPSPASLSFLFSFLL